MNNETPCIQTDEEARRTFFSWEIASRDTIDFKKLYVDMAEGDILAGLVLSEVVYWHLPDRHGQSKLGIRHDDYDWIACPRREWWDRVRMTPRQFDRALKTLTGSELLVKEIFGFRGVRTVHIRINWTIFYQKWNLYLRDPKVNPYPNHRLIKKVSKLPNGDLVVEQITKSDTCNTETTSTEIKRFDAPQNGASENAAFTVPTDPVTTSKKESANGIPKATPPKPRNLMFDAVAFHIFGITDDAQLKALNAEEQVSGRIGKIVSWLEGKKDRFRNGRSQPVAVGFISTPAKPEHVARFAEAWQSDPLTQGVPLPRDTEKFVENWRRWASALKSTSVSTRPDSDPPPDFMEPPLSYEERLQMIEESHIRRQQLAREQARAKLAAAAS